MTYFWVNKLEELDKALGEESEAIDEHQVHLCLLRNHFGDSFYHRMAFDLAMPRTC